VLRAKVVVLPYDRNAEPPHYGSINYFICWFYASRGKIPKWLTYMPIMLKGLKCSLHCILYLDEE